MTMPPARQPCSVTWHFREDGSLLVTLPTALIRQRLANPVLTPPWDGEPVTLAHVRKALGTETYVERPLPASCNSPQEHASRIAWLMCHGWSDPIELDIGVDGYAHSPSWPIQDGNHRLYAAILTRRPLMETLLGGSIDDAVEMFGIDPSLLDEFDAKAA